MHICLTSDGQAANGFFLGAAISTLAWAPVPAIRPGLCGSR